MLLTKEAPAKAPLLATAPAGFGRTSTERARSLKARRKADGLVQCNVWVHAAQAAEFRHAADLMLANPDLRVARLMSVKTGKLSGVKVK